MRQMEDSWSNCLEGRILVKQRSFLWLKLINLRRDRLCEKVRLDADTLAQIEVSESAKRRGERDTHAPVLFLHWLVRCNMGA